MADTEMKDLPEKGEEIEVSSHPDEAATEEAHEPHEPKVYGNWFQQAKEHVTGSYLNALYVFVPLALASQPLGFAPGIVFILSFFALIPLAAALGDFTEDLAARTNEAIGALINVTFGNATELIISIAALRHGEFELIKNSLVGSVLGNMLLVLGSSFIVGGMKEKSCKFNAAAAQVYMSSLLFASFAFVVPTAFFGLNSDTSDPHFALTISRQISLLMVGVYALYIWFQLKTHKHVFDGADDGEEDEEPNFTFSFALVAIAVVAVLISVLSEFMVDTVEPAAVTLHMSKYFIGMVLIPIVGNVAEHASAILMAAKGKHDIAIGIALGSSIQIGMMVMPLMVFIAWVFQQPLNMNITPFTLAVLLASVLLTLSTVSGGEANYLTGTKMLVAYVVVVIAFLNAPEVVDPVKAAILGTAAPRAM